MAVRCLGSGLGNDALAESETANVEEEKLVRARGIQYTPPWFAQTTFITENMAWVFIGRPVEVGVGDKRSVGSQSQGSGCSESFPSGNSRQLQSR